MGWWRVKERILEVRQSGKCTDDDPENKVGRRLSVTQDGGNFGRNIKVR